MACTINVEKKRGRAEGGRKGGREREREGGRGRRREGGRVGEKEGGSLTFFSCSTLCLEVGELIRDIGSGEVRGCVCVCVCLFF